MEISWSEFERLEAGDFRRGNRGNPHRAGVEAGNQSGHGKSKQAHLRQQERKIL